MIPSGLQAGTTLGHYRVISPLGAGGMGEVYLAADELLKRNVALKILPDALVHDENRLRRFMQEAQTASALNHPAIVTIYEIGTARENGRDRHFIAMELVDGKTLRELYPSRASLTKILGPFIAVAEGLAKAHTAGIVHRDLKPENIMITCDGLAKVVDFGLAKLLPTQGELGPNDATAVLETGAGMILGTVGYMSPEQVEARAADHRSDIFSLGCVLYESVAGARAFAGKSAVDTLHLIVHAEPPALQALNPAAPADLVRVISRCLAKDPEERFQSVKEVAIELRGILRRLQQEPAPAQPLPAKWHPRRWWKWAALAAFVAAIGTTIALMMLPQPQPALSSYQFTPLETTPEYEGFPSWSPDGKTIAYVAEAEGVLQVFTRSLTSSRRAQITSQPRDCREPFWSPDGTRIYFNSVAGTSDSLWVVSAAGGATQLVVPNVTSAAISPDGSLLALLREKSEQGEFTMSLYFANADGSNVRPFEHRDFVNKQMTAGALRFSPDGKKLGAWLFTRGTGTPREFWEISIPEMKPQLRLAALSSIPRTYPFSWLPDNRHVIFGGEVPGGLIGSHLWIADTQSNRLQPITATPFQEAYPSISPDGKRIVFSTEEADFDLLSISLAENTVKPLLASSRAERLPSWAPDGGSYAFVTNRSGVDEVWLRSTDGDFERPLVARNDFTDGMTALIASIAFSADGQRIAYQRSGGNFRIWISSVAGGAPVPLNRKPFIFEDHPTWSPDNEWMAFTAYSGDRGDSFRPSLMKARIGVDAPPTVLIEAVIVSGDVKWSPTGEWIACETYEGITLVTPDGAKKRVLIDQSWFAFDWSRDGKSIYALLGDETLHVAVVKVDVATGQETFVADLGVSPPTNHPFQGLSLAPDEKSIATSVVRLRGDLWLLEGWPQPRARFAPRK